MVVDMIHSKDRHVFIHICGNSHTIMDEVPEMSLDVFSVDHLVDRGRVKNDLDGKFALMGNVNPVATLWNGKPVSIKKEAKKTMDAVAPGGKFFLVPR
jgi:uroporphyrinogen-III decarboxylase